MKYRCKQCEKLCDSSAGGDNVMVSDMKFMVAGDAMFDWFTPSCFSCLMKFVNQTPFVIQDQNQSSESRTTDEFRKKN